MSHPEYPYNGNEIAVIGMAGRFPQSENLEAFWQNLTGGKRVYFPLLQPGAGGGRH
ncbi:beta-ketoacyl synthase N-terminal-like domain-containing protein [Paenibacillus rhizoplanae]